MKKLVLLSWLLGLLFPAVAFGQIAPEPPGSANPPAGSAYFVDHSTIKMDGTNIGLGSGEVTFFDNNSTNAWDYVIQGRSGCPAKDFIKTVSLDAQSITVDYYTSIATNVGNCNHKTVALPVYQIQHYDAYFTMTDSNTIKTSDGVRFYVLNNGQYIEGKDPISKSDSCRDSITINSTDDFSGNASIVMRTEHQGGLGSTYDGSDYPASLQNVTVPSTKSSDQCYDSSPQNLYLANAALASGADFTSGSGAAGTSNGGQPDACASASGAFSWVVCPIFQQIQNWLKDAYVNWIQPALVVNLSGTLHSVWGGFLTVADILFALAFLIAIFGTALQLNVDAYTVKKVLPKLVAGAILVQFSYFICSFLVDIGNIFGSGLLDLITSTIKDTAYAKSAAGESGTQMVIGYAAGIIGGAALIAALSWSLLAVIVGFGISVLTFFFTIAVRNIIIVALVVLSPVAFVAWVLPSTEKYFKMWYTNLFKAIMVYPLISVLIGAAYIVQATTYKNSGTFQSLLAVAAPVIAFFMMPMAFKWGGGLMGFAGGAIASRGKSARKLGIDRTKAALDNSALLKQREANKRSKWISSAEGTGFGARYAQRRLGMGWASTPLATNQINAMAAKEEKERLDGASRQLVNKNAYGDQKELVANLSSSDAAVRKASAEKLLKAGNYKAIFENDGTIKEGIPASAELKQTIQSEAGTIISKAPQALMSGADLNNHFENISADEIAGLSASGHEAYQAYLKDSSRVSAKGLMNAKTQFKSMGPAAVGRLKGSERETYDSMGYEFSGSMSATHERALAENAAFDAAAKAGVGTAPAPGTVVAPTVLDDDASDSDGQT